MITFRYHVVSLIATLLALAVGIALGGGPLQRSADDESSGGEEETLVATQAELSLLLRSAGFADGYAAATAGRVLDQAVKGRGVTLVTLPGADDADVTRVADMVGAGGGAVAVRATVGEKLLDVGNRQLVAELATQMTGSVGKDAAVPSDASGYEQLGHLAAHALVNGKESGAPLDKAGESILAGLETADLLTVDGGVDERGSVVVVVAGEPYGSPDDRQGASSILSSLLTVLDGRSDGVVLAGPVESSTEDGVVGALRSDPETADRISTVDAVERTAGAVVAVLALEQESRGRSGHYGTADAGDGAVPGAGR